MKILNDYITLESIVIIEILKELKKDNIKESTKVTYTNKRFQRIPHINAIINKELNKIIKENQSFIDRV